MRLYSSPPWIHSVTKCTRPNVSTTSNNLQVQSNDDFEINFYCFSMLSMRWQEALHLGLCFQMNVVPQYIWMVDTFECSHFSWQHPQCTWVQSSSIHNFYRNFVWKLKEWMHFIELDVSVICVLVNSGHWACRMRGFHLKLIDDGVLFWFPQMCIEQCKPCHKHTIYRINYFEWRTIQMEIYEWLSTEFVVKLMNKWIFYLVLFDVRPVSRERNSLDQYRHRNDTAPLSCPTPPTKQYVIPYHHFSWIHRSIVTNEKDVINGSSA